MQILLANPRGFCAGVDRAIEIVNRALEVFGAPIYVRHEVVHNKFVVHNLRTQGAIFVEELSSVPNNAIVIFSAHGVSQEVRKQAQDQRLKVFDATCPLVTKVHLEVAKYSKQGIECILIGHAGHVEVEGTLGQYDKSYGGNIYLIENCNDVASLQVNNPAKLAFVTQTTLSVDDTFNIICALRKKFPAIAAPHKEDICYATQNRQDAVKQLAQKCDLVLIVGSVNSSNSNRLHELAVKKGIPTYLIDNADEIKTSWFNNVKTVGISAGASAPSILVDNLISKLKTLGASSVTELDGKAENITFTIPHELRLKQI